jgi:titin
VLSGKLRRIGSGASSNVIGGSAPGQGNVISGNDGDGVYIQGSSNVLLGNFIGTNADGVTARPNADAGISVVVGGNSSLIGGPGAGEGNTIAFNNGNGVRVATGTSNAIRGNSIHSNGGLGIDNTSGGNGEPGHAPPVINPGNSTSGTACANCTVDIYSDSADEGRIYHGFAATDGAGNWDYPGAVTGPFVTATSTNAAGSTSEFSPACRKLTSTASAVS